MSQETASYWQSPSSREKLSQNFPLFCRKRLNRAWTICDVIGIFSGGPRRMCCNRSVVISWPSRDAVGIFWKPTFYPNHRARKPHPGDGPDPLLGPRIFRALRLGPFEGFPNGIARRLAKYANKDHQGWRLY